MKKTATALAAIILSAMTASAQSEAPDTIATFDNPEQITITTSENGTQTITVTENKAPGSKKYIYTISGDDNNAIFIDSNRPGRWNLNKLLTQKSAKRQGRSTSTDGLRGIYAGGLIPTGEHGAITGGWEIGISNIIVQDWNFGKGLPKLSLGAGLGWERQTVGHGQALKVENEVLMITSLPEDAHDMKSTIKRFHFTVPLTLFLPFDGSFGLGLTGELHLNTYTTASTSWNTGSNEHISHKYKGLHQKIATVDMTATLGWRGGAGVYVTYSPMNPWKEGYGPQYKTLAVGLSINF